MAIVSGVHSYEKLTAPGPAKVEMNLEVVVIPVSDVDRAKEFYAKLGWRLDADFKFDDGFRVVQFTPPGSGCSVQFGPGSPRRLPGLHEAPTWSFPTSMPRATNSPLAASKSAKCSTQCHLVRSFNPRALAVEWWASAGSRQLQFICNIE